MHKNDSQQGKTGFSRQNDNEIPTNSYKVSLYQTKIRQLSNKRRGHTSLTLALYFGKLQIKKERRDVICDPIFLSVHCSCLILGP